LFDQRTSLVDLSLVFGQIAGTKGDVGFGDDAVAVVDFGLIRTP
jgi:hypothetical protein